MRRYPNMLRASRDVVWAKTVIDTELFDSNPDTATESRQAAQASYCQFFAALVVVAESEFYYLSFAQQKLTAEDEVSECIVQTLTKSAFFLWILADQDRPIIAEGTLIPEIPLIEWMCDDR